MNVIGRAGPRPFSVRTRTRAMETAEETRERKLEARNAREANRERAVEIAAEAAHRRSARNVGTMHERVEAAARRLKGAPAGATMEILQSLSVAEREVYLLAEELLGANRQEILRQFPPPRSVTRETFAQSAAQQVGVPEQSASEKDPGRAEETPTEVADPDELMARISEQTEELGQGDANGNQEA